MIAILLGAALSLTLGVPASAARESGRVDVNAVQAVLAVQALDGWLLSDRRGTNPIAVELVRPSGNPSRQWFYYIPASGQPTLIVHKSEASSFEGVAGKRVEYSGYRDLEGHLGAALRGASRVAMEYAPKSGIPELSRIDTPTVELVTKSGVDIASSANLVQLTKASWGPEGRVSHHVAAHHLNKLKDEALAYVADRIRNKKPVTEKDVQAFLLDGYEVRGLTGAPPVVAVGKNTANPSHKARSAVINDGQLLLIDMWGAIDGDDRPIVARLSWVAFVGDSVPERYRKAFAAVAAARDGTIDLIGDRVSRRRALKGFEADQKARAILTEAGYGRAVAHRTGHSLDTSVDGDGANLDDLETHDTRNLVVGSGFTVGPGVYFKGDFGLRSTVSVHIAAGGVEVTTARQSQITPLLGR